MPYYSLRLTMPLCQDEHCSELSTHEVRTPTNERIGEFCARHADQLVADLNLGLPRPTPGSPSWAGR